ncbi:MAG: FAD-binding oxidoreductase [Anaerolineaceae bacterium]|nr:FAD-binding oxidoreductase [Anaerolineaceae bacterium]
MQTYDVIIIGGGFLGLSTAYQLARSGVRTLLLEAGDIGSGTSGSCSGRAQVCEGHLDPLNIALIRDGLKLHETLEEELGYEYEWRRVGLLSLLRTESYWQQWQERSAILTSAGIPTEVIDRASLQKAEPNMNTNGVLGAAYAQEGMLNPLKFTRAYAQAAARHGAKIQGNSEVIRLDVQGRRITTVKTASETFSAGKVAVMTGAWLAVTARLAGVELPIRSTHAESLITESIPRMVFNNIGFSDSYEIINGKARAVAIGVHPEPNGSLAVAEAVTQTDELHHGVSAWGISAMSQELIKLFPFLEKVRVLRSWGRPTSFAPDEEPLVGWAPQLENMYVATSLVETITAVPLLSQWMALDIQGKPLPVSLELYSPARFAA